ncbi:MAG: 50S ribosomal protein L1 [Candidatus Omnitrophica bacterium]|nr:50S ribosomal protein L1 [Candidatus Omnitrophota bacterium]MCA9424007.1 50S ribosomal protein L1 [Candidatus Omnitrophota bacterium]MCA9438808.1 50S ribosomal protein L1 [Candidatus Omnitrophota bacterium]MCA9444519.1 50S ribosomal protein L1 [Candidatus Omnitrophota bacterium]MCB9769161.1 50S ribosomal protein L1 [Candidatus Omnitrophota bacterium]
MKHGKKYNEAAAKVDGKKSYSLEEAVVLIKETATAKFDSTVEFVANLGVDPRHADQQVRGTVALPHGTGKSVKVLVFADGEQVKEAEEAGADYVGLEEYVEKITKEGWTDFDVAIATPSTMREVGKLGRFLGPRGLMPNPKTGTVTPNVKQAVKDVKAGRIEYRVDRAGVIHTPVGKASFDAEKLADNIQSVAEALNRAKPNSAKGTYMKSTFVSTTMGPSVRIDPGSFKH